MVLLFHFQPVGNITGGVAAIELNENHADELAPRVNACRSLLSE